MERVENIEKLINDTKRELKNNLSIFTDYLDMLIGRKEKEFEKIKRELEGLEKIYECIKTYNQNISSLADF